MPALIALARARGGQDASRTASPKCARRSISCATTLRARAPSSARRCVCPGPTGESNELSPARTRRIRLHQPVEFPARDLHGPGRGGAGRGQRRDRQAGRADAADRGRGGADAARKPACRPTCCSSCRATALEVGARAVADPRVAGVAFTGSTETATRSSSHARGRDGPIATLIAETGGQNAMIVDSSALARTGRARCRPVGLQQRGSALLGAARPVRAGGDRRRRCCGCSRATWTSCVVGDPAWLRTDVGPVIDEDALRMLEAHAARIVHGARAGSIAAGSGPTPRDGHFLRAARGRDRLASADSSARSSARSCTCCVTDPTRARGARRCHQRHGLRPHASASTRASTAPRAASLRACARATST